MQSEQPKERVSLSSATIRLGLVLRQVMEKKCSPNVVNAVAQAAQAVEDAARAEMVKLRANTELSSAEMTELAICIAAADHKQWR